MTRLIWNDFGKRLFEIGIDRCVLYVMDANGEYPLGVPWNGLTAITESPSGAEPSPLYGDNIKYLTLVSAEDFSATLEAYTYPEEFEECDGSKEIEASLGGRVTQQTRKKFGLVYRTKLGNDISGQELGYKLHLLYGCLASPSEKAYNTINDSPEAITFSWEITTTPVMVTGFQPTSLIIIDSTKCDSATFSAIEDQLFGGIGIVSNLPLPDEIKAMLLYLLHDEFLIALAAGSVNGTQATPGPGIRRVTDTGNALAINPRKEFYMATSENAFRDPDLYYTPISPVGAVLFAMHHGGGAEMGPYYVLSPTDRPADPTATGLGFYQYYAGPIGRLFTSPANLQISKIETLTGIYYYLYIVRRPGGGALFIANGGIYSNALLWAEDVDNFVSDTFIGIDDKYGISTTHMIQAITSSKLDARFLTKYGTCISADTFTRANGTNIGETEIGGQTWIEFGTGMQISNNALISSADNGGALVNLGSQPRIIDIDVYRPNVVPGLSVSVFFRSGNSGDSNNACVYAVNDNAGYLFVNGVNVASSGGGALIKGQVNRLRVVDFGDIIRCYTNNLICIDHVDSSNVDSNHYYAGIKTGVGDAIGYYFDNWRCYPASITPPALLSILPPLAIGNGLAIFSDDMTDTNGTALATHNPAWTVFNDATYTGIWEINTNKARLTIDGTPGIATVETNKVDHEVVCNITTPNTNPTEDSAEWFCGLVVRFANANNKLRARLIWESGHECELWQDLDGVGTLISMTKLPGLLAQNTTYSMKMAVKGNQVCVYLDGKLINQATTSLLTGTKCGLFSDGTGGPGSAGGRPTWDDVIIKAT